MKTLRYAITAAAIVTLTAAAHAQGGLSSPLEYRGMDQFSIPGARSRAMGWSSIANANDASALFSNPALLAGLSAPEARVGGVSATFSLSQTQEWYPDKPYATLSLLLEDRLVGIEDTGANQIPLEHKYDDIGPNWSHDRSYSRPSSLTGAVPLELGGLAVTLALGYSEVADLDHYFQNNNVMDPYIGSYDPDPYPRPALGDTIRVQWYQYRRERSGSINGITPGFGVELFDGMMVGVSATVLTGSSDDVERRVERGLFRFATSGTGNFNVYFVDSAYYHRTVTATSTYSGLLSTIGVSYTGKNYTLAFTAKPGGTITQKMSGTIAVDTAGSSSSVSFSATNELKVPYTYAFGGVFSVSKSMKIAADYLINRYADAEYDRADGTTEHPWIEGTVLRLGFEVQAMKELALRAGYREDTQTFAGVGAPIKDDPVRGYGLTAGAGFQYDFITIDAAYEYSHLKYEDKWISNINYNERSGHSFMLEAGIHF